MGKMWRVAAGVTILMFAAVQIPGMALAKGTPVPNGFRANSITWLTPAHGFVLGSASCGSKTCTDVLSTTDGGTKWSLLGTVPAKLEQRAYPAYGITEIRFATKEVGWAFGPSLYLTTNGGVTWKPQSIPGGAHHVLALATNATTSYVVVSSCHFDVGASCHKALHLLRRSMAGGSWSRIPLTLPMNLTAGIAMFRKSVYVWDEQLEFGGADRLYASTDGTHFTARTSPCSHADDVALTDVVATSPVKVDMLCDGNPGFSQADKIVYRSTDGGKTDTYAGTLLPYGIEPQLAASPAGNLAVASGSNGSFMDINDNAGTKWTRVIASGDGGYQWNDIVYVTATEAWVVYGPVEIVPKVGQIYVTRDAGHHWKAVKL